MMPEAECIAGEFVEDEKAKIFYFFKIKPKRRKKSYLHPILVLNHAKTYCQKKPKE